MEVIMETSKVVEKASIKDLFYSKDYSLLLIANFISRFGDSIDAIAYGWMVYKLTGSKLLLGSIFALNAIPNIIFGPFAGVLADRLNKKRLILAGYLGRGVIVTATGLLFYFNILRPWHLFLFTICNSTLETMTAPATSSIIPHLITKDKYLAANSFSTSAYRFAELIGTGMAGAIIALIGISGAIIVDGMTFFIAAIIIMFIGVKLTVEKIEAMGVKGYLKDLKVGFTFVKNNKLIRLTIILFAVLNFCLAPINVLLPVYISDILKEGPGILSAIGIALTIGTIIGGLIVGQFGSRFKITSLIIVGLIVFGIDYTLLCFPGNIINLGMNSIAITVTIFFIMGFLIPVISAPIQSYMMANCERSILGRVSSFMTMITCCATPLGASLTGFATEFLPMPVIFLSMGVIITLIAISLIFNKNFKQA
jgi:DHA3 family macrolide efflux protein-like MFS transporter